VTSAKVWINNTVVAVEGSFAIYALGTNGALGERYDIFDIYVEGEVILP
jgi:hypothetical protein